MKLYYLTFAYLLANVSATSLSRLAILRLQVRRIVDPMTPVTELTTQELTEILDNAAKQGQARAAAIAAGEHVEDEPLVLKTNST